MGPMSLMGAGGCPLPTSTVASTYHPARHCSALRAGGRGLVRWGGVGGRVEGRGPRLAS